MGIPWDELDETIVPLVATLNRLPGIRTIGSCGGHTERISSVSAPAESWWVTFDLEAADPESVVAVPTWDAWVSLEFLAWVIGKEAQSAVWLAPYAMPPYLNRPGRMLRFDLSDDRDAEGGMDPGALAEFIDKLVDEFYVPADEIWPGFA
jgi:hypothetical protein